MAMQPEPRIQTLARGFAILTTLIKADGPMTSTELAEHCGVHQSTASRILSDLRTLGYVRRVSYREFAPDFGLLALGLDASHHFDLLERPRAAMKLAADRCNGLSVSLCLWWHGRLLYFAKSARGNETRLFVGGEFPLHLSAPGLLFMMERSESTAIRLLAESRRERGWAQPTMRIPATEAECLSVARKHQRGQTLVLTDWSALGHVSAAIRMDDHQDHPLALAISGPSDVFSEESLRLLLSQCRKPVQQSLHGAT